VPVIVSFGRRRWHATTDIASLLDLDGLSPDERETLLAAMPHFRFTPFDFAARTEAEVRAMGLSLLGLWTVAAQQFVAPVGHDDDAAVKAIAEWADVARRVIVAPTGREAIDAVSSDLLKVTKLGRQKLRIVFDQHIGAGSMKKFVSTYERITRESEAKGEAKGKAEGKAEGLLTGRAELLLRQLRRRFGSIPKATAARIAKGTIVDLDLWADRVLDAKTLTDVFAAE